MSTGADNKTMPVTAEYEKEHERIFGPRKEVQKVERRVYVMRCSACDGAPFPPDARLYSCPRCKQWTYGSLDASVAPPLREENEAINAPVMAGRFYENVVATDGTDLGSRKKHREYMKANNLTLATDYVGQWQKAAKVRQEIATQGGTAEDRKARREVLERAFYEAGKKRNK